MAARTEAPARFARYRAHAANHTAGIYADMTVDGPEIGTLVLVVDRAKNLPNRRTMGKQDPYCAARLGKDARKTETDRRGGQTPRWDQELRFTVHESPDYTKIKVSIFDDDRRKTELIGETWVGLEDLLRPGGGQGDAWHTLNAKGRYAGEVRIEMTFYDSRPKAEKPRSARHSNADSLPSLDQRPAMLGPRQLGGGRPLPADPSTLTAPQPLDANMSDHQYDMSLPSGYSRPLPIPGKSQSYIQSRESPSDAHDLSGAGIYAGGSAEQYNDLPLFSDDPYALEVAESMQAPQQDFTTPPQPSTLRHDRVQTLSGSPQKRPPPPVEYLHTHSAPQLPTHGRTLERSSQYGRSATDSAQLENYGSSSPVSNGVRDANNDPTWNSPLHSMHDVRRDSLGDCYEAGPPPPPVHRNTAPAAPNGTARAAPPQNWSSAPRAMHLLTNTTDVERSASEPSQGISPQWRSNMPHPSYSHDSTPHRHNSADDYLPQRHSLNNNSYPVHLSRSADANVRPRDEMAHDPRLYSLERYGSNQDQGQERPSSSYQEAPAYEESAPPRPLSFHGDLRRLHQQGPPLVKPRAISPVREPASSPSTPQRYRTPRKSIGSNPSPVETHSSTPYSPDSFDSLNPAHTSQLGQDNGNKFEPTPMYSSQESSPTKSSPLASSPTPADIPARPRIHTGPIIGSDGRIKDPTDHLPPSSYAPEPDRKTAAAARPSPVISIKSRFGPREARGGGASSAPVSPLSAQAYSPTDTRSPTALSPLAPTGQSILNANSHGNANLHAMNGGYNLSSPYPPPVPGKVPLGGYQRQVGEPDHFEMARLSLTEPEPEADDDGFGGRGDVYGRAKSGVVKGGLLRGRKSRWGA